jgi:hypothetical protein
MVENSESRRMYIDLCLEEKLGDVSKRNILGLLPEQMLHNFNVDTVA